MLSPANNHPQIGTYFSSNFVTKKLVIETVIETSPGNLYNTVKTPKTVKV